LEIFVEHVRRAFEQGRFTNHGPLVVELEEALRARLEVPYGAAVCNGTLALQIACAALGVTGEVVTTPLSFVATTSAPFWMGLTPVFADVDPQTFTIDPASCEARITPRTTAILATHVYGFPCAVDELDAIAARHGLKIIYDASHAFGCRWRGRSLAAYGDAATLSFHATKTFHTAEGGLVCARDPEVDHRARVQRDFGFDGLDPFQLPGINAKLSELHAALGLSVLPLVAAAITERRKRFEAYREGLAATGDRLRLPQIPDGLEWNYGYYPVVFPDEASLVRTWLALADANVWARRYFHPSLNTISYTGRERAPVAEDLCPRLLCLPLHHALAESDVDRIAETVRASFL
jgi:dTDP-4-amino-4,6-dideoxygalactose transaminase